MSFEIPPNVKAAMEYVQRPRKQANPDGLDWARQILERAADPQAHRKPSPATVKMARDALGGKRFR